MPACKACGEWSAKTRESMELCCKCERALTRLSGYAVPIVRCRDCGHSYDDIGGRICAYGPCVGRAVEDDFYCKRGERRNT